MCPQLRDMVDDKLLAGIINAGDVADAVRDLVQIRFRQRVGHTLESSRLWYLATRLTTDIRRNVLGLRNCSGFRMDNDDTKSVWKLVQLWKSDPNMDSPVRYYKPEGQANSDTSEMIPSGHKKPLFSSKDFLLVLQTKEQALMMKQSQRALFVDSTHGTTAYGYYLFSIVVLDRHGHGLVVGWAISSKENHRTWELMGKNLRPDSLNCKPEVLMSDDSNSTWNGFKKVWTSLKHKLLGHWHVMKNVRERCGNRGVLRKSKVLISFVKYVIIIYQTNIR